MCISDVTYQQHPFPIKKGRGIWSAVCFSGGMGSKPKGFLYSFLLPQTKRLFNNPLVSAPAYTDEAMGADWNKTLYPLYSSFISEVLRRLKMNISDVTYQQHYPTKKDRGIWSDVCFSGGMGSKPKGFLHTFLLSQTKCFFNNPLVSTPADIDEAIGADWLKGLLSPDKIDVLEALDILERKRRVA